MAPQHLAEYLETSAARYPRRPAVVEPDGPAITYAELNAQADSLAAFFQSRGIKAGDRVALCMPKSIETVVALFGAMKAGAAYVPIDHTAPSARARKILEDCRVSAIVGDAKSVDALSSIAPTAVVVGDVSGTSALSRYADIVKRQAGRPISRLGSSEVAYILYTSGSTGMPKGVPISHANAVPFVEWTSAAFAPTEHDRISNYAPFHFDYSVLDLFLAVRHGAALYLITEELARSPKDLGRYIAGSGLTIWGSTPSALMMMTRFGDLASHTSSLRIVTFGGEVFPPQQLRELRRIWSVPEFYNMYGPTEITVACTMARIPREIPADRVAPYPIGFPFDYCQAIVLDEDQREVGAGKEGLLHIGGPSVFAGYWNRPAETEAAFADRHGMRWYNTGDVVRWDPSEGFTYLGRKDRLVKRRGFRIELGEIENALHAHQQLAEAAVIATDGDAGVKLVAVLCPANGKPLSAVELKTFCAGKLPPYMIPDQFVFQPKLPRTSTNKIDYQALKAEVATARV